MKSLDDLYDKPKSSVNDVLQVLQQELQKAFRPESKPSAPAPESKKEVPILEVPPGLPQEYIDANLKNQPLPEAVDPLTLIEQQKPRPLNTRIVPQGESLCNAENIPYAPGYESQVVRDRIAQGPRVFVSIAQKEAFEHGIQKAQETRPPGPTLAHPDTLRPGTHITGEYVPYRPGA